MPAPRKDWTDYPASFRRVLIHFARLNEEPLRIHYKSKSAAVSDRMRFDRFLRAFKSTGIEGVKILLMDYVIEDFSEAHDRILDIECRGWDLGSANPYLEFFLSKLDTSFEFEIVKGDECK